MKPPLPDPDVTPEESLTVGLEDVPYFSAETVQRLIDEAYAAGLEDAAKVCDDIWQEDGTAMQCRDAIRSLKPNPKLSAA